MRWFKPDHGDYKVRSWFALFPVTVECETRWLERVTVKYRYDGVIKKDWEPLWFIDAKTEVK